MDDKEFTVYDRLGPVTVTGTLLAAQWYGREDKPRWTDLALYRVTETLDDWRFTISCGGCSPPRTLLASMDTLGGAPVLCGACQKQFMPDLAQREKPFRYVLEITARSFVYHRAESPCAKRRHVFSTVKEVRTRSGNARWHKLFPCRVCKVPDLEDMRDDERIAEERSDPHLYLCSDAKSIIKRLYRHSGEISPMAFKLLRSAGDKDEDIAYAWKSTQRNI